MSIGVGFGIGALVGALVWFVIPIFVAISQGRAKRRSGWAYGLLLGWLGVLILAVLPPRPDPMIGECPHCREDMRVDASVCPHCHRDVTPLGECPHCGADMPVDASVCPECSGDVTPLTAGV